MEKTLRDTHIRKGSNMPKKIFILIAILVVVTQSCGYGLVKKTIPAIVAPQSTVQPQQSGMLREYIANPDRGVHYPQIPVIGYIYQNKLEIGDNLYVRRPDGIYHVFEYTTAGRIRAEPVPTPLIEPVEGLPDSTNMGE